MFCEGTYCEGVLPEKGAVRIDPDEIKESFIPEYKQIKDAGDSRAASVVHEESSALGKRVVKDAYGQKLDVIMDVVGYFP